MENRHKWSWKVTENAHKKGPGKSWKTTFSVLYAPCINNSDMKDNIYIAVSSLFCSFVECKTLVDLAARR